jgi:3-oxoacyl-[acyl-carrier-protein] synthase-3
MAGLTPLDIDQILYATCTPDTIIPSTACWLQLKLGAHRAWAADLNAACSGFVYALTMADQRIRSGMAKNVLVVGADVLSAFTDWQDRSSCILFGDAAGAAVLTRAEETDRSGRTERNERTKSSERNAPSAPLENTGNPSGILAYALGSDGRLWDYFHIPAGGSRVELTPERWSERQGKMKMKGPEIFKVAVKTIADEAHALAEKSGVNPSEVDWLIPHQANLRIVEAAVRRLRFPMEKVLVNVDRYGNTSSATIPTLLDEAVRDGRIKPGQLLCLSTFGAGLTWGTLFLRW